MQSGKSNEKSDRDPAHLLQLKEWEEEQNRLKSGLKHYDDFSWTIRPRPGPEFSIAPESTLNAAQSDSSPVFLRYVGGVDLSFWKGDPAVACGAIVVMDLDNMSVVFEDFEIVRLTLPYIAGFLAFRESPVLLGLLHKQARTHSAVYPQVLMVDGNGILHPRGFGLACHLGVVADIPTIGVAKNLHHVDGLTREEVRLACQDSEEINDISTLIGSSGQILGAAFRSHSGCRNPVFISIGHRISLKTAISVVQRCCKYRIPEPIRQADIRSREKIRVTFGN